MLIWINCLKSEPLTNTLNSRKQIFLLTGMIQLHTLTFETVWKNSLQLWKKPFEEYIFLAVNLNLIEYMSLSHCKHMNYQVYSIKVSFCCTYDRILILSGYSQTDLLLMLFSKISQLLFHYTIYKILFIQIEMVAQTSADVTANVKNYCQLGLYFAKFNTEKDYQWPHRSWSSNYCIFDNDIFLGLLTKQHWRQDYQLH